MNILLLDFRRFQIFRHSLPTNRLCIDYCIGHSRTGRIHDLHGNRSGAGSVGPGRQRQHTAEHCQALPLQRRLST